MKNAFILAVAIAVSCGLGDVVCAAEAEISQDVFAMVPELGMTVGVLGTLELDTEALAKAKTLIAEAEAVAKVWHKANDAKLAELGKGRAAAQKRGDKDAVTKLQRESNAMTRVFHGDLLKRCTAVLAVLPDDETRHAARGEFLYRSLHAIYGTKLFFDVGLSKKQTEAMRKLCVEAVKADLGMRMQHASYMVEPGREVLRQALTKVLSPDQAVQAYKLLAERQPAFWPPEKAPKPLE
jgi:hypothetical protein